MCYTSLYWYYTTHTHPHSEESVVKTFITISLLHAYIKYNKTIYKLRVYAKVKQKKRHKSGTRRET